MAGLFGRFEGTSEPFIRRAGDDILVEIPLHFEAGAAKGIVASTTTAKSPGWPSAPHLLNQGRRPMSRSSRR
jgi:hypothetical protein